MTWLTWRQFRVPALSVFGGLAAVSYTHLTLPTIRLV